MMPLMARRAADTVDHILEQWQTTRPDVDSTPIGVIGRVSRLSRLIERTAAAQVFVLGDFLHAAAGRVPALDIAFTTWRATHSSVSITLVQSVPL